MSATQEKMPQPPPPPFSFAPFEKAVMESIAEGIVVFDSFGRLLYANQSARRLVEGMDELAAVRPDVLRRRLSALGGRPKRLQVGGSQLGDAVFLPASESGSEGGGGGGGGGGTLAERERRAIMEMLEATGGRLAEASRRLGISRTTLWRRLKAYGLHRFRETH
jgi:transcriptional regulator of acetoin/glycerol metabolism